MSIGYACIVLGEMDTKLKGCTLKNASNERILEILEHNLNSLENIIDYNIRNRIFLFRISSDMVPFGSSIASNIEWDKIYEEKLSKIGQKILDSNMRVSMHPGQYTVLNARDADVYKRSVEDIKYHDRFLNSLNLDNKHKIIVHIGGAYNDKSSSIKRFIENIKTMDEFTGKRLVIENDDRSFDIGDILSISHAAGKPAVFDNLHNELNPNSEMRDDLYWIKQSAKTWREEDGISKIHYSIQDDRKKSGSHSQTINVRKFADYYNYIGGGNIDIMLEVKDKNLSAVKCMNAVGSKNIKLLEDEWARYKYAVLERSPANYRHIRSLLKDKKAYPVYEFYDLIDEAMSIESVNNVKLNALLHVWGYFKDTVEDREKKNFLKKLDDFNRGNIKIKTLKTILYGFVIKYNQEYLKDSYYFLF